MPGEDGFAVCRRIRSLTEVPILFLSARTDEAAVLEGWASGQTTFCPSPSGWQSCGAGSGASAAAKPHPGAPDGAQRRSL